ncbi:MAG TPA: hypothetical protein VKB47_09875 [Terracidiphilus sp.]|nr:hypothetical protein [Terracidiphilus sp.]
MQSSPSYFEQAVQVGVESQIAVYILLSPENDDIHLMPLRPHPLPPEEQISPEEFARRQLRGVGVVGLSGAKSVCAFKEPLEPSVVDAIARAFLEHIFVLCFAEQREAIEIVELKRLYSLPDNRVN